MIRIKREAFSLLAHDASSVDDRRWCERVLSQTSSGDVVCDPKRLEAVQGSEQPIDDEEHTSDEDVQG